MNIADKQDQIIQEFSKLSNWEDRYKKIIDMGKQLPAMDESLRVEGNKVRGCQSQVWLWATLNPMGKVEFTGDSDAMIVKGLVAILLKLYSGSTPQEIIETEPTFLKALGFEQNLSPSRTNGLYSMIKQIKHYAIVFYHIQNQNKA